MGGENENSDAFRRGIEKLFATKTGEPLEEIFSGPETSWVDRGRKWLDGVQLQGEGE